jgi:hypothetical protein
VHHHRILGDGYVRHVPINPDHVRVLGGGWYALVRSAFKAVHAWLK